MNKTTIELARIKKHWASYGLFIHEYGQDSSSTLNTVCSWSQKPENKGLTVYRHVLRIEEENLRKDGVAYKAGDECDINGRRMFDRLPYDIPFCDLVYYLDIYYQ